MRGRLPDSFYFCCHLTPFGTPLALFAFSALIFFSMFSLSLSPPRIQSPVGRRRAAGTSTIGMRRPRSAQRRRWLPARRSERHTGAAAIAAEIACWQRTGACSGRRRRQWWWPDPELNCLTLYAHMIKCLIAQFPSIFSRDIFLQESLCFFTEPSLIFKNILPVFDCAMTPPTMPTPHR
jgi:hypothetical protein